MTTQFRTLAGARQAEIRERGSRFVAVARPARDAAAVRAAFEEARRVFADATHHAWACRLAGPGGAVIERSHDAGEPAGTAGRPILDAIRGADLLDVVVIVTRWFGGTRLGKGGLARAYRGAARAALDDAPVRAEVARIDAVVDVPIAHDGEVRGLLARHGGEVRDALYDAPGRARLAIRLPEAARAGLAEALARLTGGSARLEDVPGRGGAPHGGTKTRG
jgi:putative IMPACT (imprinted ancient) family translation regulator